MALYKESFFTLRLFVAVFYVGSGLLGLWNISEYILNTGFYVWDAIYLLVGLIYTFGGLYFIVKAKELLPKYRKQVIHVITGLFLVDVALVGFSLVSTLMMDPTQIDPILALDPSAQKWALAGGLVSLAFSFAVYLVIVHAINTVSGFVHKQSKHLTIAYWIIVLIFLVLMLTLFQVGSFEGM